MILFYAFTAYSIGFMFLLYFYLLKNNLTMLSKLTIPFLNVPYSDVAYNYLTEVVKCNRLMTAVFMHKKLRVFSLTLR